MDQAVTCAPANAAAEFLSVQGSVVIVCPGGLEHGGGIGRQMGYFLTARKSDVLPISYEVVDSRGPWFLGASKAKTIFSLFYLVSCSLQLTAARLRPRRPLAHINVTGRGSTLRKIFVAGLARLIGIPYLLHVHDYDYAADYARRGPLQQSIVRRMFQAAERVIVLGGADKERLETALRLPAAKVIVMHNAVPLSHGSGTDLRLNPEVRLLFLGYLSERKGVSDLLQALASASVKSLSWRAIVAGDGDQDLYRARARALGVEDRIEFPGWLDRDAVEKACAGSDILVLPSYAEGLAMAVLEGLSCGLAVVTTPVGAHSEVIEDGVSGMLLPPGDIPALVAGLAQVIGDGDFRQSLQRGARRRFLEKFEIGAYADRLASLHAEILAKAGR